MIKTRALAASAVLAMAAGFAACGDDDDDASGDTTSVTVDAGGDATSADDDSDTTAAGEATGTEAEPAAPSGSVPDDVTADCQAIQDLSESLPTADAPAVGEDVTDEYKDSLREAVEALEDIDLQSDEGDAARDSLVDDLNTAIDADTWTEELQALGASEEMMTFGAMCAATLTES